MTNKKLLQACETFFESWFGPPICAPEHSERVLARREQSKKEFADLLYRFIYSWQEDKVKNDYLFNNDDLKDQIRLLLPLAKGYVDANPGIRSTECIIEDAENILRESNENG